MAHSRKLIPQGLIERAPVEGMPELGDLEFVMLRTRRSSQAPVAELSAMILAKGEEFLKKEGRAAYVNCNSRRRKACRRPRRG